jgi:hypothetical protein
MVSAATGRVADVRDRVRDAHHAGQQEKTSTKHRPQISSAWIVMELVSMNYMRFFPARRWARVATVNR